MKKSSDQERRERIRQYHQANSTTAKADTAHEGTPAPQATATPIRSKGRFALFLLICLLGSGAVSFVVFKYVAPAVIAPSIPRELIGTWEVTNGNLKGATLEFTWHGTAIATSYVNNVKDVATSDVRVEGKRLLLTSENPQTKKADTVVQTIVNLTDSELVIRDEDKNTYRMVRVQR